MTLMRMHPLWGLGRYSGSFRNRPISSRWVLKTPTLTKYGQPYLTNCKPPRDDWQHLGQFIYTLHTLPWLHRSVMTGVYEIRASSPFWPMCSISRLVLIAYHPNFHMFGRTQSCTITCLVKSYIYYFFILIGSPTLVPATYTWTTNTEQSGFYHHW